MLLASSRPSLGPKGARIIPSQISPRLAAIVEALPLRPGLRVLEIGCGPGAAARAVAQRIESGHILAIDRSAKAVEQALAASHSEIASGRMGVRRSTIEDFELAPGEQPFDFAFAVRVGALDGRKPELERRSYERLASVLKPGGFLYIDGGDPLREIDVRSKFGL